MEWDITYNGSSIKSIVSNVTVSRNFDSYCDEVSVELLNTTLYSQIDWTVIPSAPLLEVFIDSGFGLLSVGKFYVERPTYSADISQRGMRGIWGRSRAAGLADPFAGTVTLSWTAPTYLYDVIAQIIDGTGISLDLNKTTIPNFKIEPLAYSCSSVLPIDAVMELAELCGGVVRSNVEGNIYIVPVNYAPDSATEEIVDLDIIDYSEEIQFPDFGNRVLISSDGASSGYSVELSAPTQCLATDGGSIKVYARIADDNNVGVNGAAVGWSCDRSLVTFANPYTVTGDVTIVDEEVTASGFYGFNLKYPPMENGIVGVYWKQDTPRAYNFAAAGYTIDGSDITLTSELTYCDQTLFVTYKVSGVAENTIISGSMYGTELVYGEIAGAKDKVEIYVGNPCKCSDFDYGIKIVANPAQICSADQEYYENGRYYCNCSNAGCISQLLVAASKSGPIKSGMQVIVKEVSKDGEHGVLNWERAYLGDVAVAEIPAGVTRVEEYNSISHIFYVDTDYYWKQIDKIEIFRGMGWEELYVYPDISGKTISWRGRTEHDEIDPDAKLKLWGKIYGAALNSFIGMRQGTATIAASMQGLKEDAIVSTVDITVSGGSVNYSEDPHGPGSEDGEEFNAGEGVKCGSGAATTTCAAGQQCCNSGGSMGCHSAADCKAANPGVPECVTQDCTEQDFSDTCLANRFKGNRPAGCKNEDDECSCARLCDGEFDTYGTTQDYDNSSMVPIAKKALDAGEKGSPEYWASYNTLKDEARAACLKHCESVVSKQYKTVGPTNVTVPGGYQYGISPAPPGDVIVEWSTSMGEIDQSGFLTLKEGDCGVAFVAGSFKAMCSEQSGLGVQIAGGHWEDQGLMGKSGAGRCGPFNCYPSATTWVWDYWWSMIEDPPGVWKPHPDFPPNGSQVCAPTGQDPANHCYMIGQKKFVWVC